MKGPNGATVIGEPSRSRPASLERHRSERRAMVWARPKTEEARVAVWGKVFSDSGLAAVSDPGSLAPGSRLSMGFGREKNLEAQVQIAGSPGTFSALVPQLNNITQQYSWVWIDSSNTHTLCFRGSADESGTVLTYQGDIGDPVSGRLKTAKVPIRILSPDQHTFEMLEVSEGREDRKFLEITYTRKAA